MVDSEKQPTTAHFSRWRMPSGRLLPTAMAFLAMGALVAGIAMLAASRHYFGFGTESDFLDSFLNEATAFLHGKPLEAQYHPPFYAMCVALLHTLVGDWFTAGRVLSVFSAAVALVSSFFFFRSSVSETAAWGAVIGLAISPIFIEYAALATSDVFFLALYSTVLLLAHRSEQQASPAWWFITGFALALALLTRTNALTLVLILAAPWLAGGQARHTRARGFCFLASGTVVPIAAWVAYALISHSNPLPVAGTATNLALHYFPPQKGAEWADGIAYAQSRFPNLWAVISHDPIFLIKSYLKDLYHVFENAFSSYGLFAFPGTCFTLPGLIFFFIVKQPKWLYYAVLLALAQLLLVNLMGYQARFYLFLPPVIGALAAEFIRQVYWRYPAPAGLVNLGQALIIMLLGIALYQSGTMALAAVNGGERELSESIPAAEAAINHDSVVVARKPVISYYTSAKRLFMPPGKSLNDLMAYLADLSATHKAHGSAIYVYYGTQEHYFRPEYQTLLDVSRILATTRSLKLVARSPGTGRARWVLYQYLADRHEREQSRATGAP
ncbi:MAG: glycosyltransferase family 39 protein [Salinisphaera sp.]|uniref:ArnT family glycosyltransferase n=1 Tax=Salinisphaera sp. TaxID=1914330 RepID=UPI003C7DB671